jgi:hypothetical protein
MRLLPSVFILFFIICSHAQAQEPVISNCKGQILGLGWDAYIRVERDLTQCQGYYPNDYVYQVWSPVPDFDRPRITTYRVRYACPLGFGGTFPDCSDPNAPVPECPENQVRFSVDDQAAFCGSGSCNELVDVIIGSNAAGNCLDMRQQLTIDETCGDQSLVCWTTTDDTVLPSITSLDTPITSNTGGLLESLPDVITDTDVQIIDDGATTITNTETTVETLDGDTVTEKTTTTTNNITGESTTYITTKTTNENGDVSVNGFKKTEQNTGEDGPDRLSSGGDSCIVPPSCSGDAIDCGTQKQVWLNRCATNESISDILSCSTSFECDGDPIACAARKLQNDNYCTIAQYSGQTAESVFSSAGLTSIDDMDSGSALSGVTEDIGGDVTSLIYGIQHAGGNVTAGCPAPIIVSFGPLGNFEMSYVGVCGLAEITRPILLFFSVFYSMFGLVQVLRGH